MESIIIFLTEIYKQERMLHQLQSTVETEESRWKSRLGEKEAEFEQVRK